MSLTANRYIPTDPSTAMEQLWQAMLDSDTRIKSLESLCDATVPTKNIIDMIKPLAREAFVYSLPVIYNEDTHVLSARIRGIDHGSLTGLGDDDHAQYILVAGTRAFTGDQAMGSHRLTGLAAPTTAGDAIRQTAIITESSLETVIGLGHARQHSITATADHTSSATSGQILKANANGLPVDATNTDAQVSAAVTASHARGHGLFTALDHTDVGTYLESTNPLLHTSTPQFARLALGAAAHATAKLLVDSVASHGTAIFGGIVDFWDMANIQYQFGGSALHVRSGILCFSDTDSDYGELVLLKSHSDTFGTPVATIDGEWLGGITFRGIGSGNTAWADGAYIYAKQNGAAGALHLPTDLYFFTATTAGTNQVLKLGTDMTALFSSTVQATRVGVGKPPDSLRDATYSPQLAFPVGSKNAALFTPNDGEWGTLTIDGVYYNPNWGFIATDATTLSYGTPARIIAPNDSIPIVTHTYRYSRSGAVTTVTQVSGEPSGIAVYVSGAEIRIGLTDNVAAGRDTEPTPPFSAPFPHNYVTDHLIDQANISAHAVSMNAVLSVQGVSMLNGNVYVPANDVIVDLATKGLVLKDTQDPPHYWRTTVSVAGALVTSDLGHDRP